MKLVSFSAADGKLRPGALIEQDNLVVDLSAAHADTLGVIAAGITKVDKISDHPGYKLSGVTLHAPLANPPRVFAIGLNYKDHAKESNMALPKYPVVFFKLTPAIVGPGDTVILPKNSTQPDYEAEFAFVIGKVAKNVPLERALDYVAGYMILNDVSARDLQNETSQWFRGKSPDTFAPTGPYLVTRDEVPDPHALDVRLWLNGQLMQSSNTRQLIFNVPFLVHHLSKTLTLEPGDIISTGTPSGVGMARKPPVFLKAGDVVRIEIGNLGVLENPVAAE